MRRSSLKQNKEPRAERLVGINDDRVKLAEGVWGATTTSVSGSRVSEESSSPQNMSPPPNTAKRVSSVWYCAASAALRKPKAPLWGFTLVACVLSVLVPRPKVETHRPPNASPFLLPHPRPPVTEKQCSRKEKKTEKIEPVGELKAVPAVQKSLFALFLFTVQRLYNQRVGDFSSAWRGRAMALNLG